MDSKEIIKEAIRELHREGELHIGCPWIGVSSEKIESLKSMEPLPTGAVKMVMVTWDVLSKFGTRVGNTIAGGLFIVLIVLLLAGFFGFGKVCQAVLEWMGK